ncbi:MAG: toll/interleukin-1 receptor domain-containing protein [Vicinamibacterales bacterium]
MISYRTADRAVADELHRELEAAGLAPWMDYKRIQPGSKWRDELLREVTRCDAFVALLTPAYVESEHCRMEVFLARSRGVPILPVMLEDCFEHLDRYEETKGLADLFLLRLYRLSVVGLAITREDALRRLVDAARSLGQAPPQKAVYVAYCNDEAELATRIASELERAGVPAWVATRDCRVGDNWRQAQARGVMHASVQLVVMDRTIARSHVLRTEIMLGEAFGLPVLTVLGRDLANDPAGVADVMASLRAADLTFRRLTDLQPFGCDEASVAALVAHLRSTAGVPAPAPEPAPR